MTAATLHELVARVPEAARPFGPTFRNGKWYINPGCTRLISTEHAAMLHEASITRYLIGEIKSYPKGSRTLTIQNCGRHWHINNDTEHSGSLLEALVAAAATLHGQRDGERRE